MPDHTQVEQLATGGGPYVLAFFVLVLIATLVWVFAKAMPKLLETYRADMKEKRADFAAELERMAGRHDEAEARYRADMKELRGEFITALKEINADHKAAMSAVVQRLDRIESKLDK